MKNLMLICLASLVGACAYTPQEANLAPTVTVAESNVGAGREIAVKVVDERSTKTIGHRGGAAFKGAKITTDQDIASVFSTAFHTALNKIGFRTVPYDTSHENKLRIDIRELNYYTSTGFWTGGVHTRAAAKVTAGTGEEPYEKVYTSEDEKRVVFVPGADQNERMLNETMSMLINEVIGDQDLITTLTQTPSTEPVAAEEE